MQLLILFILCCAFRQHPVHETDDLDALSTWKSATIVSDEAVATFGMDSCFKAYPISDHIFQRIQGKSYKSNCTVHISSLRYLRVLHRNINGQTQLGEIICNASIADDLLSIFRQLYEQDYKIERITLIDDYDADDEASMKDNNTSCFNFRPVAGTTTLSKHSRGLAIDINPLYNPCLHLRTNKVQPTTGKPYSTNRQNLRNTPVAIISKDDLCYRLFTEHGFQWGGNWNSIKDYQHFEK